MTLNKKTTKRNSTKRNAMHNAIQRNDTQHNFNVIPSAKSGSAKANGREPKSCLGRVFNFKLVPFVLYAIAWHIKKHALA